MPRLAPKSNHLKGLLIVLAGVVLVSFDALLVRLTGVSGWNVGFWRGAFTVLSILVVLKAKGQPLLPERTLSLPLLAIAILNAGSGLCLILSFTLTSAANAVVFLSAAPLFAAISARILIGEACPFRTWIAIGFCSCGVVWVVSGSLGGGSLSGDLLALLATLLVGLYFTLYRKHPTLSRAQGIGFGGLALVMLTVPFATPLDLPSQAYLWLAVSGLVQMPLAMGLITSGTRLLPAAEVSLFLLLETLLAPIWVWAVFGEIPVRSTWLGGGLIVFTLIAHTLVGLRGSKFSKTCV